MLIDYHMGDIIKYKMYYTEKICLGIILKVISRVNMYRVYNITRNEIDNVFGGTGYKEHTYKQEIRAKII